MKKVLIPAILAIASLSACSQVMTGAALLERLSEEPPNRMAIGYVVGVIDAIEGVVFCAPQDATVGQAADLVYSALTSIDATHDMSAAAVIAVVLEQAWPCDRRKRRNDTPPSGIRSL
jgi:hypothetical protein